MGRVTQQKEVFLRELEDARRKVKLSEESRLLDQSVNKVMTARESTHRLSGGHVSSVVDMAPQPTLTSRASRQSLPTVTPPPLMTPPARGVSPDAKQRVSQMQAVSIQAPDTARYACQDASAYPPLTPLSPSRVLPHSASTGGTRATATASPVRTRQSQVQ